MFTLGLVLYIETKTAPGTNFLFRTPTAPPRPHRGGHAAVAGTREERWGNWVTWSAICGGTGCMSWRILTCPRSGSVSLGQTYTRLSRFVDNCGQIWTNEYTLSYQQWDPEWPAKVSWRDGLVCCVLSYTYIYQVGRQGWFHALPSAGNIQESLTFEHLLFSRHFASPSHI